MVKNKIIYAVLGGFLLAANVHAHDVMQTSGFVSLHEKIGFVRAAVISLGLWYFAQSDYVKSAGAKNLLQRLAVFLSVKEGVDAFCNSSTCKSSLGQLPIVGPGIDYMFFQPTTGQKTTIGTLAGLTAAATVNV